MSGHELPAARRSKFLVRELAEETIVYDEGANRAHCLNRTAALVWKNCDGRHTVRQIAAKVGERLSSRVPVEVVRLALHQLAERALAPRRVARRGRPVRPVCASPTGHEVGRARCGGERVL